MAVPRYISCPYCLDHQSHVTKRRWWDYLFFFPYILLGRKLRRCEHCNRRFWAHPKSVLRGEEDLEPVIKPNAFSTK